MKISDVITLLAKRMSADGDLQVGINVGDQFKTIANSFMITTVPDESGKVSKYLIFSDTPAEEMKKKAQEQASQSTEKPAEEPKVEPEAKAKKKPTKRSK